MKIPQSDVQMTHPKILTVVLRVICIKLVLTVIDVDTNRTERRFKGGSYDLGRHESKNKDISRYGLSDPSSEYYFDYGPHSAVPFGVNVPQRTYLPPLHWPDYSGGYPPVHRPTITPPVPPPSYLPPRPSPVATSTEFTLPEVIDARSPTFTANENKGAIDPKLTDGEQNRNRWTDTNFYRDAYSREPVKIIEMECDNGPEGHFRATLQRNEGVGARVPVFEDSEGGRLRGVGCAVRAEQTPGESGQLSRVYVEVPSVSFSACGVYDCSDGNQASYLCARLRFPAMEGLRLADDVALILRCRIQELVAIHTKHFHLPVSSAVLGRSAEMVATGGASNAMRCELEVLRRGPAQQFSKRLVPGTQVLLGEELLVRLTVADGDGWRHSRLGEVTLGAAGARVVLLTADGCAAEGAAAICPQPPRRETALVHSLVIRAPIFEGSEPGASAQLSVRVLACRRARACAAHCSRDSRSLTSGPGSSSRAGPGLSSDSHQFNFNQHFRTNDHESVINYGDANSDMHSSDENVNNSFETYVDRNEKQLNDKINSIINNSTINRYTYNENNDSSLFREVKSKFYSSKNGRTKRASMPSAMTANSLASVNFTVIRPGVNIKGSDEKSKGDNEKPIAMITALGGLVVVLMLAVGCIHKYT